VTLKDISNELLKLSSSIYKIFELLTGRTSFVGYRILMETTSENNTSGDLQRPLDFLTYKIKQTESFLLNQILEFARNHYSPQIIHEAWKIFQFNRTSEFINDNPHNGAFIPWFVFHWKNREWIQPPYDTLAQHFSAENQLDPFQKEFLTQAIRQPFSFYDVLKKTSDRTLMIRDLFLGTVCQVPLDEGIIHCLPGDLLFAHSVRIQNRATLTGYGQFRFPPIYKKWVFDLRKEIKKRHSFISYGLLSFEYEEEFRSLYFDLCDDVFPQQMVSSSSRIKVFYTVSDGKKAFLALKELSGDTEAPENRAWNTEKGLFQADFPWTDCSEKNQSLLKGWIQIRNQQLCIHYESSEEKEFMEKKMTPYFKKKGIQIQFHPHFSSSSKRTQPRMQIPGYKDANLDQKKDASHQWMNAQHPILDQKSPYEAAQTPEGQEILTALIQQFERQPDLESFPLHLPTLKNGLNLPLIQ
tara:strand:- start:6614 stop:8017 length:1404 start_codon:yes stop_codon:yes gene_type:complete